MNRVRGNQEFLDGMPKQLEGGVAEVGLSVQFQIVQILIDISKSLAIIADNTDNIGSDQLNTIFENARKGTVVSDDEQRSEV